MAKAKSQYPKIKINFNVLILTRAMSHYGLAIYMKKYLKAKEELELRKLKSFTMQKYNL
jgi:hypothetical protein